MITPLDSLILHLSLISGVGIETIKSIVSIMSDSYSVHDLYSFSKKDFQVIGGLSEKKSTNVFEGLKNKDLLEKELYLIEKHNTTVISFLNPEYPALLNTILSPAPILYYKGASFSSYASLIPIAIVGSRKGNYYATQVVKQFVPILVKNNAYIVSGGAYGVDTMAHEATLEARGKTIVVLGSGISKLYPYQNKKLFERIVENGGTIVTTFSVETEPLAPHFPERNRIISGLSKAVVIVQAAEKSGAYITARAALDQGREICVVPGSIFDPLSAGCHTLIKEGAQIADCVDVILEACSIFNKSKKLKEESNDHSLEAKIIRACRTPVFFDELLETFDTIENTTLQSKLCFLQISGKIKQDVSGAFVAEQLDES